MIEPSPRPQAIARIEQAIGLLNRIPYSVIVLPARLATFSVFFRSFLVKISDWNATQMLFQNEYHVPILPPNLAAVMAASMESCLSICVLLGLFARLSALGLLGMVLVIQIFVYPSAWPDHIQWLGFMIIIICRGPGAISLDALIKRVLKIEPAVANPA